MADNRMHLIHRPTGVGVMIGKRTGHGWSGGADQEEMARFYNYVAESEEGGQDDFAMIMEDGSESVTNWEYAGRTREGFKLFRIVDSESEEVGDMVLDLINLTDDIGWHIEANKSMGNQSIDIANVERMLGCIIEIITHHDERAATKINT